MSVSLSETKAASIVAFAALAETGITICNLTGICLACAPVVPHAALFTKCFEIYLNEMIRFHKYDYQVRILLFFDSSHKG